MCARQRHSIANGTQKLPDFVDRFSSLIDELGGPEKAHSIIGISVPTMNYWKNGKRTPSAENLKTLSEKTGKSVDWLLGLVDENNYTSDETVKLISEYTGLSTEAVQLLHYLKESAIQEDKRTISFLNLGLLEPNHRIKKDFNTETIFSLLDQYIHTGKIKRVIHEERRIPESPEEYQIQEGIRHIEEMTVTVESSDDMMEVFDVQSLYRAEKMRQITEVLDYFLEEEKKNGKA